MFMIQAEYNEAVRLHKWLEVRGIKHFHVPNETGGNAWRGSSNKRMGVSAGVPDYFIFLPNGKNVALELKRGDSPAYATEKQKEWLKYLSTRGFDVCVAHGAKEAVDYLKAMGYDDDYERLPFDKMPF